MIDAIMALEGHFHLLVIDDGSPDGTANIVRDKQDDYGTRIFLIEEKKSSAWGRHISMVSKWGLEPGLPVFI
jgi:dolichol-phosphate mannosyltransferase